MNGITQGLSNNTSLKELDLSDCFGVTPPCWVSLSNAIRNNPALPLERLHISASVLRGEVMTSITSILIDNKSLKELTLRGQLHRSNEVLLELSNALVNNRTLKKLILSRISEYDDQSSGIKALSRVLCNRTSVDATFTSNHTLESIYFLGSHLPSIVLPSHLTDMLQLNRNDNKFEVSRQKILRCHLMSVILKSLWIWICKCCLMF